MEVGNRKRLINIQSMPSRSTGFFLWRSSRQESLSWFLKHCGSAGYSRYDRRCWCSAAIGSCHGGGEQLRSWRTSRALSISDVNFGHIPNLAGNSQGSRALFFSDVMKIIPNLAGNFRSPLICCICLHRTIDDDSSSPRHVAPLDLNASCLLCACLSCYLLLSLLSKPYAGVEFGSECLLQSPQYLLLTTNLKDHVRRRRTAQKGPCLLSLLLSGGGWQFLFLLRLLP